MKQYKILLSTIFLAGIYLFSSEKTSAQSYTLTPSGYVCGSTTTISMSGSLNGWSYQLNDGSNVSSPVTGTGSAISWSNVTIPNGGSEFFVYASVNGSSPTMVAYTEILVTAPANGTMSTPNGTVICGGAPVTLSVIPTGAGPYNYEWFENGMYIQGAANAPSYTATTAGNYSALIDNSCGGNMLPAVTVTASPVLGTLSAITGNQSVPANTASTAYTASAANASSYTWTVTPQNAGTISGTGTTGTVTWNTTFSGVANISVTANGGCSGVGPSNNFAVAYNSSNYDYNYIQETDLRIPNITTVAGFANLPIGQKNVTYTYFDGLGRPIQKVMQGASTALNDVVMPMAYDQLGRQAYKYMPYTTSGGAAGSYRYNALTGNTGYTSSGQYQFYQLTNQPYLNTQFPFAQTSFESSPLSRAIEQGFEGSAWQVGGGHTARPIYTFNNNTTWSSNPATSMKVALYTATINSDGSRTLSRAGNAATYNSNQLTVTVTEDENWTSASGRAGTTEQYQDIFGHVVLKRVYNNNSGTIQMLSTYYVYDAMGLLAFVLTPMSNPDETTSAISQTTLDNLCYQYQYDERNRRIAKKLPGKGWEYTVYNNADQVVAIQDAVQRTNNQWIITKYDGLGRVIMTGMWNYNNTAITPAALKTNIYAAPQFDVVNATSTTTGYTINSYPQTLNTILTINYYDGYAAPGLPSPYVYTSGSNMVYGLLTTTKTTVLNTISNTTPDMLWTAQYYDGLGRVTNRFQQHYLNGTTALNAGNYDATTITYSFANQITTQKRYHYNTMSAAYPLVATISTRYFYDQTGRKISAWEQLTNGANGNIVPDALILLSKLAYNEIGQLATKNLHATSADSVHFLQSIAYAYNERGWLTNNVAAPPSNPASALFSMQLQYNLNPNNLTSFTAQYNGNIASQIWTSSGQATKNYAYTYDNLNRLTNGISSFGDSEQNISYDSNGNISALQRTFNGAIIDNLSYNYTVSSNPTNQLQYVQDTNNAATGYGFASGTFYYTYDANGNLWTDAFRQRTVTQTNILNLPQTNVITGTNAGTITYFYDADGKKLRKTSTQGSPGSNRDYIDGIEYDGPIGAAENITFIQTEEGRATPATSTSYDYQYNLTDHLGNVRLIFDSKSNGAPPLEEDDYLPFGTDIQLYPANPINNYLYNKKELQPEFNEYDYGARFYDPVIARWNVIDPLAEKNRRWSPYNYGNNNPIREIDPDGMLTYNWDGPNQGLYTGDDGELLTPAEAAPLLAKESEDIDPQNKDCCPGHPLPEYSLKGDHTKMFHPSPAVLKQLREKKDLLEEIKKLNEVYGILGDIDPKIFKYGEGVDAVVNIADILNTPGLDEKAKKGLEILIENGIKYVVGSEIYDVFTVLDYIYTQTVDGTREMMNAAKLQYYQDKADFEANGDGIFGYTWYQKKKWDTQAFEQARKNYDQAYFERYGEYPDDDRL